jgi:hypothetical protein
MDRLSWVTTRRFSDETIWSLAFGTAECFDQFGERAAIDALAGFDGSDAERCRQMRFSGAGRDRDILPDTKDSTRRSNTRFIHTVVRRSRLSGVIVPAVFWCWWSNSPTTR